MTMQAPTHTIPVCLFELHGEHENRATSHAAQEPAGAPDYHDLRKIANNGRAESQKSRRPSHGPADRFGPGRLSQRRRQTERLQELRIRRATNEPTELVRTCRSRESTDLGVKGVKQALRKSGSGQQTTWCPQVASSRESCQHISLGTFSGNSKDKILPRTFELLPVECIARTASGKLAEGNKARVTGDFVDWGNGDSGLNPWTTTTDIKSSRRGKRAGMNGSDKSPAHDRTDRSTSSAVLKEGPMRRSENSSPVANGRIHPTATVSAAILPIKSSPCSLRSARSTSQGSKRRLQTGTDRVWSTGCRPGDGITSGIAEATGSVRSQDAESSVNIYAHGATSGAEAFLTQAGALVQPELGMPGIADARGGVILRLSPSERSLDPWDTLFAPLRAMCDIEPSLSRAGMEYRGVISAVEGVHEIKTHDQTKRKLARDAKSLLGRDVRPRTSEPRLHTAGIAAELDVMKVIIVRERLVVTLQRLTRRLRRHCFNLEGCLRREAKFRWRYAKHPPNVVLCATNVARKTLHTEKQELMVVLAHLRAISLDTVKAVTSWRATFVTTEKPTYRQLRPTGSPHDESVLDRSEALFEGPRLPLATQDAAIANTTEGIHDILSNNERQTLHAACHAEGLPLGGTSGLQLHASEETSADFISEAGNASSPGNAGTTAKSNNCLAAFYWKGQNYIVKMAHDLEFLDDPTVSNPVSTWLGFVVHNNPFLIPPEGLNTCETLRREHKERREAASVRRRHRRRDSNSRRRSNSRTNRNTGADDCSLRQSRRPSTDSGRGVGVEAGVFETKNSPQSNLCSSPLGMDGAMITTMETHGVDRGSVEAVDRMAEANCAGSASASTSVSVDHRRLRGLDAIDAEVEMVCELSSGEEEEVRWSGGGHLDAPIIPTVPDSVRATASVAEGLLRRELASERTLENQARAIMENARRAEEIIDQPRKEASSRVDSLAQKSFSEDLRGALKDRQVSVARLRTISVETTVSDRGAFRRVFTAPAAGSGSGRRMGGVVVSARGNAEDRGKTPSFGRGGVYMSADGWTEERGGDDSTTRVICAAATPVTGRTAVKSHPSPPSSLTTRRRHRVEPSNLSLSSHFSRNSGGWNPPPRRRPSTTSYAAANISIRGDEGSSLLSPEPSAERSTGQSADHTDPPSLQASTSSMSDRARDRARAHRPTATRHGRNGGKIVIVDPATSKETREKSARLIQTVFFGARARSSVRRVRARRAWAATTIGRVWRGWRVRVVMWTMRWVARAERLKRRVTDRARSRAAHLVSIFFRDIVYRKRRDRRALFLRDRERITREIQEQVAAIVIQGNIRRFQASIRVKSRRLDRRRQAQARIARAARERAASLRQTGGAPQQRDDKAMERRANMRKKNTLPPDEAATRMQAWLRGVRGRRAAVAMRTAAGEASIASSPSLQAALGALEDARSVALASGRDSVSRLADRNPRRTHDINGVPDRPASPPRGAVRWEARVAERRNTPSRGRQRQRPKV